MPRQHAPHRDSAPPPTRSFLLIRHGISENHRALLGSSDPPLSPEGRRQVESLADELADTGIEAIVSSRLRRATETARILGRRQGLPPETDPRLNEISYGEWDGLTWAEIERRDSAAARAKLDDWRGITPPGGEPFDKFRARVDDAVRDLLRSGGGTVAVVAHVGVNALVEETLRRAGQPDAESNFNWNFASRFQQDFATYRRIEVP